MTNFRNTFFQAKDGERYVLTTSEVAMAAMQDPSPWKRVAAIIGGRLHPPKEVIERASGIKPKSLREAMAALHRLGFPVITAVVFDSNDRPIMLDDDQLARRNPLSTDNGLALDVVAGLPQAPLQLVQHRTP